MIYLYNYPNTTKEDFKETIFGKIINDPFRWLENLENTNTQQWIQEQNNFTMETIPEHIRKKIEQEYLPYADFEYANSPYRAGKYLFYKRKMLQKNQPVLMVKNLETNEKSILLDPNEWSEDGTVALDWFHPSSDGTLMIYGKSSSGDEWSTLYIIETETLKHLTEEIPRTRYCSIAWKKDNSGFYYTRYPEEGEVEIGEENYNRKIFYHKIGENYKNDPLIIGDLRAKEELIDIYSTKIDGYYIITRSVDWSKNDCYLYKENGDIITLAEGYDGFFSSFCVDEDRVIMNTNYEAPKGKIIAIYLDNPSKENWKTIIDETAGIIAAVRYSPDYIILDKTLNAYDNIYLYNYEGEMITEVKLPFIGTIVDSHKKYADDELYIALTSFVAPDNIYKIDLQTQETTKMIELQTNIDTDNYIIEQHFYHSYDNTKVPLFLIRHKETTLNTTTPLILNGYGGFNINSSPTYRSEFHYVLDKGIAIAVVNLRGGGEYGKEWHEAGRRENKQNVFDDFSSAAEWLISHNYTSSEKLAVLGGSNGGLLVGAFLTQRPELAKVVLCGVPLLDMYRFHKFLIGGLWIPEYGNPDIEEELEWIAEYSPYHHIKPDTTYPATYIFTAESDTRVHPMHAMKMAAKLQTIEQNNPILLFIETKAGHGVGKPVTKKVESISLLLGFLFWNLEI